MGASGAAIFDNDLACDVRGTFTEALEIGRSAKHALRLTLEEFVDSLEDDDEADEFWIALAASMNELGRLTDAVRDRALEAIASGRSVARWQEIEGGSEARKRVLGALRDELLTPSSSKRTRIKRKEIAPFQPGDVLRIPAPDDRMALAFVFDAFADNGGRYNALRLLRRDDGTSFSAEEFLRDPFDSESHSIGRDFLVGGKTVPSDIVRRLEGVLPPEKAVIPPLKIERWNGGWRIDLVGTVTTWEALPLLVGTFLDDLGLNQPKH